MVLAYHADVTVAEQALDVEARAQVGQLADGQIDVVNRCRKADGSVDEITGNAHVRARGAVVELGLPFAQDAAITRLVTYDYPIANVQDGLVQSTCKGKDLC